MGDVECARPVHVRGDTVASEGAGAFLQAQIILDFLPRLCRSRLGPTSPFPVHGEGPHGRRNRVNKPDDQLVQVFVLKLVAGNGLYLKGASQGQIGLWCSELLDADVQDHPTRHGHRDVQPLERFGGGADDGHANWAGKDFGSRLRGRDVLEVRVADGTDGDLRPRLGPLQACFLLLQGLLVRNDIVRILHRQILSLILDIGIQMRRRRREIDHRIFGVDGNDRPDGGVPGSEEVPAVLHELLAADG
mmetsp:Transcript_10166/g.27714  ORF Transcript_10166/g.27714 Transcript_10166/m.27714 type:complete len:247 (-) Transcript_10166:3764-4504(-)